MKKLFLVLSVPFRPSFWSLLGKQIATKPSTGWKQGSERGTRHGTKLADKTLDRLKG